MTMLQSMQVNNRNPCNAYDLQVLSNLIYYVGSRKSDDWTLVNKYCHPNATQLHGINVYGLMKVVFKTDSMQNKTGFSASVQAGNFQTSGH